MNASFVGFDTVFRRIGEVLEATPPLPGAVERLYLVRDLFGKVRIVVAEQLEGQVEAQEALQRLATALHQALGARAYEPERAVLFVDEPALRDLAVSAREVHPGILLADRLVTGQEWTTVADRRAGEGRPVRWSLYSVKGGVGRSTTTAVLAWHLAQAGRRVMVLDLDLESPGLSSSLLEADRRVGYGVVDWFVEDLVGQAEGLIGEMVATPAWAQDLEGEVWVVAAHGREPGEYLAKLGRVYLDAGTSWTKRLSNLVDRLEGQCSPDVVLMESRSGLHDLAAATVTDLDAQVLLFATDSDATWDDYDILFRHWRDYGLAPRIRDRLSIVSALTPELETDAYLEGFREHAWNLFRDRLYDEVPAGADPAEDLFSFDLHEENAPHDPLPIHWNRGLAAGTTLRRFEATTVAQAYSEFLTRFDLLMSALPEGDIDPS